MFGMWDTGINALIDKFDLSIFFLKICHIFKLFIISKDWHIFKLFIISKVWHIFKLFIISKGWHNFKLFIISKGWHNFKLFIISKDNIVAGKTNGFRPGEIKPSFFSPKLLVLKSWELHEKSL